MAALSRSTEAQSARRAEVEAAVLAATEELLGGGASFAGLSIERITRAAGISRPAFYFYFRDKRELLMRLTEDVSQELYAEADAWWSAPGPGEQALVQALRSVVAFYGRHGVLLRAVVQASTYDEPVAGFWRAMVGRFGDATRVRIEAEQAGGHIAAEVPAGPTAFALSWMTERTCYQHVVSGAPGGEEELLAALSAVWLRAVYGRL